MIDFGTFSLNDYMSIPVQGHDTSGSAANLDSGSLSLDFYEKSPSTPDNLIPMSTPSMTFNSQIDGKTGFYAQTVFLTATSGFVAGRQYVVRVSGTFDSQTPANTYHFRLNPDGQSYNELAAVIGGALPELTGPTGATPTLAQSIMRLLMEARNATNTTNSLKQIPNDAGTNVIKKTITDVGGLSTEGKDTAV